MTSPRGLRTLPVAGLVLAALVLGLLVVAPRDLAGASVRGVGGGPVDGAAGIGDAYWPRDGNGGIDVRHYDVAIDYRPATGRLVGRTTLTLRARTALRSFHLDLLLDARSVRVDGVPADFGKPHPHELEVRPRAPLHRGQLVRVEVRYGGTPGRHRYAGSAPWISSASGEVLAVDQPHVAPWWFPANDHPRDRASFDIAVTGPADRQVVANGLPAGRRVVEGRATTRWRAADPMAPYLAFFAMGRYRIERSRTAGVPSIIAVSRDLGAASQREELRVLRRTGEVTAWLSRRLATPYPFESTGGLVTAHGLGFALENQTRPVYDPAFRGIPVVVHEVAHQWFGDDVTLHRWRDIWLNEGFAQFFESAAWPESHGGPSGRRWLERRYAATRHYGVEFWGIDLTDPGARQIFDGAVYDRGAMAVQALRNRIGEHDFWRLLRTWLARRGGRDGTIEQFRRLAGEVSGERLVGFFRAWLEAPVPPRPTRANGLSRR